MRRPPWQLAAGTALIGAIVLAAIAAPLLTPYDPLQEWHFRWFGTHYLPAPFAPGAIYPLGSDQLGRDIWSNLLYGARLTLGIAFLVLVVRLVVGTTLGALAGWFAHRWPDRAISVLIDAFAAFPTLLFAILWILAFDIRAGASSFVIALVITGWWAFGRTVRSAIVAIRRASYLEAAESLGLSGFAVVVRHVVPNVLPLLAVTAALDAAAIVLALGELGFLGFVVGGGQSTFVSDTGGARVLFFGSPEWGGLLLQGRFQWQRNWWIAVYPSLAFAVTILGFNLLGHGLRAQLERSPIGLAWLFRPRVAVAAAIAVLTVQLVLPRVGPEAAIAPIADTFDAARAKANLDYLADPARGGRWTGSPGYNDAAAYVADRFREMGLQPMGDTGTYFQHIPIDTVELTAEPELAITAPDPTRFTLRQDFSEAVGNRAGGGTIEAPVVFAGAGVHSKDYSDYENIDPKGKIVMVLAGRAPPGVDVAANAIEVGAVGLILVASSNDPLIKYSYLPAFEQDTLPTVRVTMATADRIIGRSGRTVEDIDADLDRMAAEAQRRNHVIVPPGAPTYVYAPVSFETSTRLRLSVPIGPVHRVDAVNVVGMLPAAIPGERDRYLMVGGHLDGVGTDPDGTVYPAANDNASGPAIAIEVARVVASQRARLRASVIFIAFCGEEEGLRCSDAFVQRSITEAYRPDNVAAFVNLDVAGCCGTVLGATDESYSLHARLAAAAERHGIPFDYAPRGASDHISFVRKGVAAVMVAWLGYGGHMHVPSDDAASVDAAHLRAPGVVTSQAILEMALQQ